MRDLTIVGLGPGPAGQLTAAAAEVLRRAREILVRDASIPALDAFRGARLVELGQPEERVAEELLARPGETGGVALAVLGSPHADCPWLPGFLRRAEAAGASVALVPGRSLLDAVVELAGFDFARSELQVLGAERLVAAAAAVRTDPFLGAYRVADPARPLLVGAIDRSSAQPIERLLSRCYAPGHSARLIQFPFRPDRRPASEIRLDQLGAALDPGDSAWLYLPPVGRLDDVESFDTLTYIAARLRGPGGCPWDREQTFPSLKKHLIEEAYEAVDALDRGAYAKFAEELGDVLLQVVMNAQLGRESGEFGLDDVLRSVNEKLVRRHPHVFGDAPVSGAAEVLRNWERIKRDEARGSAAPESTFGGVPAAAPALLRADAVQGRAARYGWLPPARLPDLAGLTAPDLDSDRRLRALGDALFGMVAAARREHLDPEEALRLATNRFIAAFDRALAECRRRGVSYESLPPDERRRLLGEGLDRG